ncbi:protease modulator HflC [Mesobaculum littorinae]|uniref:Protease modulator HflC n=1 Tax=Mesobaculum littorinae TaxID=2486419 RepID=A0A438AIW4_9RHOB|nr:protease modulator HflC [Mesobaculum littorinae]RVV98604.1 protease modulator HflC [Mesobaculum littorinae]
MRKLTILVPILIVAVVLLLSSIFIVKETEKALVLQFGQIKKVQEEPGIGFKVPFVQQVVRYDDRILSLDTEPFEVTPSDDRRLVVDAFARYRIADVVQFREATGAGGVLDAERRLANILNAQTRAVLGAEGVTSNTILSEERSVLMERIRDEARERAQAIGLDVVDVRLKQTNLPEQNLEATFARMRAEREREAADEVARGEEAAQRVRALADRTVVELVSEANREAEIVRGEADARRNAIYGQAYGANPEFFEFYRSLEAYQRALNGDNSTMVMSPEGEFFNYLRSDQVRGEGGSQSGAAPAAAAGEEAAASQSQADDAVTDTGTGALAEDEDVALPEGTDTDAADTGASDTDGSGTSEAQAAANGPAAASDDATETGDPAAAPATTGADETD